MSRDYTDPERVAKAIKRQEKRIRRLEKRRRARDVSSAQTDENGILVDTNCLVELYEDDLLIQTSETSNTVTELCDEYLASTLLHVGDPIIRPHAIAVGTDDSSFDGEMNEPVGDADIIDSKVINGDAVITAYLDGTAHGGSTLREMGLKHETGLFNHAPINPPVEMSPGRHAEITIRMVFLHD